MSEKELRLVKARGSRFEIGKQIGVQCRDQVARIMEFAEMRAKKSPNAWEKMLSNAKKSLPYAIEFDASYIEELRGYSEGAGIVFDDLFASLFGLLGGHDRAGCTSVALNQLATSDHSVFHAHNEDSLASMEENLCLVRVEPSNEPSFIAVSYYGIVPTAGLNNEGISVSDNSLYPNDAKGVGIAPMFPLRKVLSSRTLGEALSTDTPEHRAAGSNHIICHSSGEVYDVEASATSFEVIYPTEGYLIHTNHYATAMMKRYEENLRARLNSSVIRYNRASRLVREKLGQITVEDIKRIMSDHINFPNSICCHPEKKTIVEEQSKTISSIIMDLTHLKIHVCRGNPCEGKSVTYSLASPQ